MRSLASYCMCSAVPRMGVCLTICCSGQVTSLERVTMMQYGGGGQSACMAAYNQLRCAETY